MRKIKFTDNWKSRKIMRRNIQQVAVLGSGVMGSRIACHFANIGVRAILLDIVPKELSEEEKKMHLTLEDPKVRNRIVEQSFKQAISSKPSPLYRKNYSDRITLGNFEDDLKKIEDVDWIIEAVVENLEIKRSLYDRVEKFRKAGTLISTNTSGIPINLMLDGRSEDFQKHFCGTHFFNPPRYLQLLEIIPSNETDPEIVRFFMDFGFLYLGKETVECKDTPAFIANRIGVYGIMSAMHEIEKMGFKVNEIDRMTGQLIGRPKSATFRTLDVVGLDTMVNVANNLYSALEKDESREKFKLPGIVKEVYDRKWWGEKSGKGFFKKTKNDEGETDILELNLETFEYQPRSRAEYPSLEAAKDKEIKQRLNLLINAEDKAGEFYRNTFYDLFRYCTYRIPEITDEIYKIDQAVSAGFGWEMGPFKTWDALGLKGTVQKMESLDQKPAEWVYEMLDAGQESFYKAEKGVHCFYDIKSGSYKPVPGTGEVIILGDLKDNNVVWENSGATLYDMGDEVLNLEFHTKMNSIGAEVIEGINIAISKAEENYKGLVIGNEAANFSAGANLSVLFMYAGEQEFDEINLMIAQFQKTMTRARFSSVPVIAATAGMALGGGCELSLHCDRVQAHAETYMGLVEVGAGLIPAGGGTKEMTLRASDAYHKGDPEYNVLQEYFMNIATAKVATSAHEAIDMDFFDEDSITMNRKKLIADAKEKVLALHDSGYTQPLQRNDIKVQGRGGMAFFEAGIAAMKYGQHISEHDAKIAHKLSYVMNGGDLSYPQMVSEQYLLDLEREAFLSLTGERKTLERIQSILFKGKPLRN